MRKPSLCFLLLVLALVSCGTTPRRAARVQQAPSQSKTTAAVSPEATPTQAASATPTPTHTATVKASAATKRAASSTPAIRSGSPATIAVSVATVWGSASAPRGVDAPALESPVRYKTWLRSMSTDQRRSLGPTRVNTSVLLDEKVIVTSLNGSWAHVVVPSQKSPWDSRGYPGWMPVRQLSASLPPPGADIATVTAKTTMLHSLAGANVLEISYATRLPIVRRDGSRVQVWHPDGQTVTVAASDVSVHSSSSPASPKAAASMIADAKRFLGLAYLWDGSSAYGFDCSGITYQVFRTHGVLLPRDSFAQVKAGRSVDRASLKPGDLVFFATNGKVHHVGIWLGDGKMLHAPHTGASVEIVTLSQSSLNSEYYTARRFV